MGDRQGAKGKGESMTSREAAAVIRAMSESLTAQPNQFELQINVTGQSGVSHGGTGISATAIGGGPGSKTIGQQVFASMGNVEIQQGKQDFNSQLNALIVTLNRIADGLESPTPDKGALRRLYESLLGTWVPGVITSVIRRVLSATIGLPS